MTTTPATTGPTPPGGGPPGRPRRRVRTAEVIATERTSPNVQRVTLVGDLHDLAATSPGAHVKLFLPPDADTPLVLPTAGPDGPVWPDDAPRPVVRTYTPRRYDVVSRQLQVDLVLHGDGPAARWATTAAPGDRIGVAGPGRGYEPDADTSWFLLAGDETALSALIAIAAALPQAATARVVVEVPTSADAQPITSRAALEVTWLPRDGAPAGRLLGDALGELTVPDVDARAWVAAEAATVRAVREELLARTSLPRDRITVRGYWKRGEANHPDHDYGD